MSITIVVNLDVVQESADLPMRVDLTQTLSSSEASEPVDIQYSLNPDNDVWFAGTPPAKTASRNETIAAAETTINHRLTLVRGDGDAVERVKISQTITDELGIETPDQTFVTIVG